jgi:hypothetical protein
LVIQSFTFNVDFVSICILEIEPCEIEVKEIVRQSIVHINVLEVIQDVPSFRVRPVNELIVSSNGVISDFFILCQIPNQEN